MKGVLNSPVKLKISQSFRDEWKDVKTKPIFLPESDT